MVLMAMIMINLYHMLKKSLRKGNKLIISLKHKCMVFLTLLSLLNRLTVVLINSSKVCITRRLMLGKIDKILGCKLVGLDVYYELLNLTGNFNNPFIRI